MSKISMYTTTSEAKSWDICSHNYTPKLPSQCHNYTPKLPSQWCIVYIVGTSYFVFVQGNGYQIALYIVYCIAQLTCEWVDFIAVYP